MDLATLRAFEGEIGKVVPGFKVAFKNTTKTQKIIGWLVRPFNADYMTKYVSTFAPMVYFGTPEAYESNPKSSFVTLAHELVHLLDTAKQPWWFRLSYLFPQILAPLVLAVFAVLAGSHAWVIAVMLAGLFLALLVGQKSLPAFAAVLVATLLGTGALAVIMTGWMSLVFFGALFALAPWPAFWRTKWELRGYSMNLAFLHWTVGNPDRLAVAEVFQRDFITRQFVGPSYFFMSWDRKVVLRGLEATQARLRDGSILDEPAFKLVHDFLKTRGLAVK